MTKGLKLPKARVTKGLTACDRELVAFASVLSVFRLLLPSSKSPMICSGVETCGVARNSAEKTQHTARVISMKQARLAHHLAGQLVTAWHDSAAEHGMARDKACSSSCAACVQNTACIVAHSVGAWSGKICSVIQRVKDERDHNKLKSVSQL